MPRGDSRKYTQRHYQDVAALLAAERTANGASPALNRITAAFATLFTEDSRPAALAGDARHFSPVLFRQVALGEKPVTARPARRRQP